MDDEEWQDTCPLYPIKQDGGLFWSDLVLTYNAYEKGILPEPGGLGSQPLKFLPMMALISSRTNAESEAERERMQDDSGGRGKRSLTEEYLEQSWRHDDPLTAVDLGGGDSGTPLHKNPTRDGVSPDGHAAVPGLIKPRAGIGRR